MGRSPAQDPPRSLSSTARKWPLLTLTPPQRRPATPCTCPVARTSPSTWPGPRWPQMPLTLSLVSPSPLTGRLSPSSAGSGLEYARGHFCASPACPGYGPSDYNSPASRPEITSVGFSRLRGDNKNVDKLVRDIYGGDYDRFGLS